MEIQLDQKTQLYKCMIGSGRRREEKVMVQNQFVRKEVGFSLNQAQIKYAVTAKKAHMILVCVRGRIMPRTREGSTCFVL